MISDENDKKLRNLQANEIKKAQATYSYSQCINDALEESL